MDMKELMTEAELDNVVGGRGFLYYRQNGNKLSLFVSDVPLNADEMKSLTSGTVPTVVRLNEMIATHYFPEIEIGKESKRVGDVLEKIYGKFEDIKVY